MAKRKMVTDVFFVKNPDGVSIKVCCASCEHKAYGDSVVFRKCLFSGRTQMRPGDCCSHWEMSEFWKRFKATGEGDIRTISNDQES